jgi:hypothetical protein
MLSFIQGHSGLIRTTVMSANMLTPALRTHFYRHLFLDAGYDDIFSNHNRSVYIGGGVKFTDKDLKYLIVGGKMPMP